MQKGLHDKINKMNKAPNFPSALQIAITRNEQHKTAYNSFPDSLNYCTHYDAWLAGLKRGQLIAITLQLTGA